MSRSLPFTYAVATWALLLPGASTQERGAHERTRLVFRVDFEAARERWDIRADNDPMAVLRETADTIRRRIGRFLARHATVQVEGEDRILVEIPAGDDAATDRLIARVSSPGMLEMPRPSSSTGWSARHRCSWLASPAAASSRWAPPRRGSGGAGRRAPGRSAAGPARTGLPHHHPRGRLAGVPTGG